MLPPPRTCPGCICFSRAWTLGVTMQAAATMAPSASALPYRMLACSWLCCSRHAKSTGSWADMHVVT